MRFAKVVFLVAGVYGLIVMAPQYFLEAKNGRDFPPAINHPEFYYGFIGIGVAWQVLFIFLSRDPVRYRPMMIPSMLEKVSFFIAAVVLYLQQRIATMTLGLATVDAVLLVLFVISYLKTKESSATEARG